MYKRGDILRISDPETVEALGGFDEMMFVKDAASVNHNPAKYIGEVRPVCDAYIKAGESARGIVCEDCKYHCAKHRYMAKYVGEFEDAEDVGVEREILQNQATFECKSPFLMQTIASGRAECHDISVDYVILEYVDGINLKSYIQILNNMYVVDREAVTVKRLDLIRQLLFAVRAYAKQYSVRYRIHRDLKPSNMMVHTYGEDNRYQRLKILDFDFLLEQGDIHSKNLFFAGTEGYMHPKASMAEVGEEDLFIHEWDLYAVGLIIYEIMSGEEHFFNGDYLDEPEIAYTLREAAWEHQYPELKAIAAKLIAEPQNSYKDIDDVIADYQSFIMKENASWFKDYYIEHWLECGHGYDVAKPFAIVYCKVSSEGLKDCWQSFTVTENTAVTLEYGKNIIGYNAIDNRRSSEIGAFYYMNDMLKFLPYSYECSVVENDIEYKEDCMYIDEGSMIKYKDIRIHIENIIALDARDER